MTDTQPISSAIADMIRMGTTERQIVAAVARMFPELTTRELVAAVQDALAQAEREAASRH